MERVTQRRPQPLACGRLDLGDDPFAFGRLATEHPQQDGLADAAQSVEHEGLRRAARFGPHERDAPGLPLGISADQRTRRAPCAGAYGLRTGSMAQKYSDF